MGKINQCTYQAVGQVHHNRVLDHSQLLVAVHSPVVVELVDHSHQVVHID